MGIDPAGGVRSWTAGWIVLIGRGEAGRVWRMTKKKNHEPKSLDQLLRVLKAQAKKIQMAKKIVPEEIANDPRAILEWLRLQGKRERRRRKWS